MPAKDSWGGPAACEPPFVEALRRLGVEVITEDYVFGDKDRPTPFFSRITRVLKTAFRFRRLLKEHSFDLVFINSSFDLKTLLRDTVSLAIMKPGKAKVFLKLHGSLANEFVGRRSPSNFLIESLRRRIDAFGVFTREERGDLLKLGFDDSRLYRVKNAITVGPEIPGEFSRTHKDAGQCFELIFVSRFVPTKGLIATIHAVAILRDRGISVTLACVGDGETRAEAEALVDTLQMREKVTFTGYIPETEVTQRLLDSDILVFPTTHPEGFPIVLFKAIATGLPIITTQIRAAADYLSEPENCLFCTNEPEVIANRLAILIENRQMRETMSAANCEYGREFLPEAIATEYLAIFHSMIDSSPLPKEFEKCRF